MFYLCNLSDWFAQIIREMQTNRLSVEESRFVITLFSSMDFEMVEFFRSRGRQVSAYSGDNLHIFTPILYDGDTIPDREWDDLRNQFETLGIPLGYEATAVVFAAARGEEHRFVPQFIGAYHFPDGSDPRRTVKGLIDICKATDVNDELARRLETVFKTPNLIRDRQIDWHDTVIDAATKELSMPTLFISHSSKDKPFVRRVANELISDNVRVWVDENEVLVGDNIRRAIDAAMNGSDYFAFVMSKDSVKSDWVRYEIYNALSRMGDTKVLPLVVDDVFSKIPDTMTELKNLRYLDFTSEETWGASIVELKTCVRG